MSDKWLLAKRSTEGTFLPEVPGLVEAEQSRVEPSDQHFLIIKLQINLLHSKRQQTKGTLSCCQHLIELYLLPRANKVHLNAFLQESLSK